MSDHSRPEFIIYCDESRHDPHERNSVMGIGGIWVQRDMRDQIKAELKAAAAKFDLHGEVKWSKTSMRSLPYYQALLDVFLKHESMRFRVLLIDQARLDFKRFHEGDRELGFYKFYYEMLVKWIEPNNEYVVLLDDQVSRHQRRHTDLRRVLDAKLRDPSVIRQLTVSDSRVSPLPQLADLLTGAVTASACGLPEGSPKRLLVNYLSSRLGRSLLHAGSSSPAPSKFNVFRIQLQDRSGSPQG